MLEILASDAGRWPLALGWLFVSLGKVVGIALHPLIRQRSFGLE
jgi:hypothetical protein